MNIISPYSDGVLDDTSALDATLNGLVTNLPCSQDSLVQQGLILTPSSYLLLYQPLQPILSGYRGLIPV
jgi:hypothetical protein